MSYARALWLALRIWTPRFHPRYDHEEPFDCIGLATAWKVATGIWIERKRR